MLGPCTDLPLRIFSLFRTDYRTLVLLSSSQEYSYIEEADKRAFYMAIDLWKKEAGAARQGHKDFIPMAVSMIPQLGNSVISIRESVQYQ